MTVSNESREFFKKLSKIWQNFKDYTYLEGINLSQEQINIIEQDEDQLLIEGYAGTGKSLTLLYKFINVLVREENKKILYVTFNNTLIEDTKKRLNTCSEYKKNLERHEVHVMTFHEMASKLLQRLKVIDRGVGRLTIEQIEKHRGDALRRIASIQAKYIEANFDEYKSLPKEERLYATHDRNFVTDEIAWIKAMGFTSFERYLATERTGRSKSVRLTRNQRKTIFKIYEDYQRELSSNKYGLILDLEDYALKILEKQYEFSEDLKYDYIFVDEMQDLDPMQILALCKLTNKSIVLSGDAKQRIYKKCPVKYEDLGLQVRQKGKRKVLKKNYRSTAEIVRLANSLNFYDDEDKFSEKQFVKEGEKPIIHRTKDIQTGAKYIADTIKKIHLEDPKKTVAIIHREEVKKKTYGKSEFRLFLEQRLMQSFSDISNYYKKFDFDKGKQIFYTNAYDVKGLEFDVVFIVDFNKWFYPHSEGLRKIRESNENKDKELVDDDVLDFINTEKKLLYVAMTRAKEKLYLIANSCEDEKSISEFIFDFDSKYYKESGFTKSKIEQYRLQYKIIGNGKIYKRIEKEKQAKIQADFIKGMEVALDLEEKEPIVEENNIEFIDEKEDIQPISEDINFEPISEREVEKIEVKEAEADKASNIEAVEKTIEEKEVETSTENEKETTEKKDMDIVDSVIKPLLTKHKIKFVDKRDKGGAFWIVGGMEIHALIKTISSYGLKFTYLKNGGKATGHKSSWYIK